MEEEGTESLEKWPPEGSELVVGLTDIMGGICVVGNGLGSRGTCLF